MPNAFLPAWFRERCFVLQQRGASAFQRLWGAADPAGSKALRTIKDTSKKTLAINQLGETGPEKLAIRLGGIYALERIARDSERDHWPIMEILTAYVREHAPWKAEGQHSQPKLAPEIQAILTVLGRRTRSYGKGEDWPLDLSFTDLRRAALTDAHLERAVLWGTHLEDAVLSFCHFEGALLHQAYLDRARLIRTNLKGANLWKTCLERTFFWRTHLEGAIDLTFEQAIRASALDKAHLDPLLREQIQQRHPELLKSPEE